MILWCLVMMRRWQWQGRAVSSTVIAVLCWFWRSTSPALPRGLPRLRTVSPSLGLPPPLPYYPFPPSYGRLPHLSPRCSSGRYTSARRSLGRCHSPSLLPLLPFFILLTPPPPASFPQAPRRIQHAFPTLLRGPGNRCALSFLSYHFASSLSPSLGSAPEQPSSRAPRHTNIRAPVQTSEWRKCIRQD